MFILTDGKYYVGENPMKGGEYVRATSPLYAKKFTYKQARALLQNNRKKLAWVRGFQMIEEKTGEIENKNYKGNGGVYIGNKDIEFDKDIFDLIYKETDSILGLAGWSSTQLKTYKEQLRNALSKADSGGKKPQAHKMTKVGYLLDDVRDEHKNIKQCLRYVEVMEDAIQFGYSIEKIKLELSKAKNSEYQGRTEYYQMALDLLR